MAPCDLLIEASWCLPMSADEDLIEGGAVAISGGRIEAVGTAARMRERYQANAEVKLPGQAILPGLVNAHCHAAMNLLRGAAEDLPLQAWLEQVIWPLEGRVVSAEFVEVGANLAIAEMLSRGITCFADMYFYPEEAARCVHRAGMRAQITFPIIDFPNPWTRSPEEAFHRGLALHDAWRDDARVRIGFGPHAAYSVGLENLQKTLMYAEEIDRPIQMHIHENAAEVALARARTGHSWIQHLEGAGLLGPRLQAVHMTRLSAAEIELIAERGVRVVHCPTSNLKLASGICPLTDLRAAGICVALGTDGVASNNALDLFAEARLASLLTKQHSDDAAAGSVTDMLRLATLGGAETLGLESEIGSLEAGKWADLIAVDLSGPAFFPVRNPATALLHGPAGSAVTHTWVAGKCLYAQGEFQTLDLADLRQRATHQLARMAQCEPGNPRSSEHAT